MKKLLLAALLTTLASTSHATDCPPPPPNTPPGCKVITLLPQEEQALVGSNMILDTARQGRPLDLGSAVDYFREKVRSAPLGTVATPAPEKPAK